MSPLKPLSCFIIILAIIFSSFSEAMQADIHSENCIKKTQPNPSSSVLLFQMHPFSTISLNNPRLIPFQEQLMNEKLHPMLIETVLQSLNCLEHYWIDYAPIITIIDYSLPSNQKRLWVFDLKNNKRLFHTYVSHGLNSGQLYTNFFSNRFNSRASSIGLYKTEKVYVGREGLSLRLTGVDSGFNHHALGRYIVMHGGWYMDERFIQHYGRAGRSWGCPALPLNLSNDIIHTIKNNSLLLVYYPSIDWLDNSKFLNCKPYKTITSEYSLNDLLIPRAQAEINTRGEVIFLDKQTQQPYSETKPLLVMSSNNYEAIYHKKPTVDRLLRRQINHTEFIALNTSELDYLTEMTMGEKKINCLKQVEFILPFLTKKGAHYHTEMKFVNNGNILDIKRHNEQIFPSTERDINQIKRGYQILFDAKPPYYLNSTATFIRWLGL